MKVPNAPSAPSVPQIVNEAVVESQVGLVSRVYCAFAVSVVLGVFAVQTS